MESAIKIAALTTGFTDPSARFRVRQHIGPLRALGINVREHIPLIDKHAGLPSVISDRTPNALMPAANKLWRWGKLASRLPGLAASQTADLVWLNREIFPGRYTLERFLRRPFALDVDDAVWRARPDGASTMSRLGREARVVLAGNRYIADWFSPHARNIHIVPTAIDTDRFFPAPEAGCTLRPFVVGWTGTGGNFKYLYDIEAPLKTFLLRNSARLIVIADRPPVFKDIPPAMVEFQRWSPDNEALSLRNMDVGLMPLPDNEWTRGKCSFKMLQYMSTGLPVVVSPVGMNGDVLKQASVGLPASSASDWFDALDWICRNRDEAKRMGSAGRQVVLDHYSRAVVSRQIAGIFKSL